MDFEVGKLIEKVPHQVYLDSEGVSSSGLKLIKKSPAHFYADRVLGKRKATAAMTFGSHFHDMLLLREDFKGRIAVEPDVDKRTKDGKLILAEWEANLKPGMKVLSPKDAVNLTGMVEASLKHPFVKNLLSTGLPEISLWWNDNEFEGQLCKARYDFISDKGYIVDIKTTMDAEPDQFNRRVYSDDLFYPLQMAHYCAGIRQTGATVKIGDEIKKINPDHFIIVAIEKEHPFGISVHHYDQHALGIGDQWRTRLIKKYRECKRTDTWPCYDPKITTSRPPNWVTMPPEEDGV